MAQTAKIIKRRIKSIKNTRQITKAMELVAASKMQRAVQNVLSTRPYAKLAWNTINAVAAVTEDYSHPLLVANDEAKKTLLIVFASDRGLAGPFNTNLARAVNAAVSQIKQEIEAVAVGKRAINTLQRRSVKIIASFEGLTNKPAYQDILPIGSLILSKYLAKEYSRVKVVYTDFESALKQKPVIFDLLPLGQISTRDLGETKPVEESVPVPTEKFEYLFEPSPDKVLDRVLPRLVETMIYQSLLESAASEHSARMIAMKNATEAAGEMLGELNFTYNQIRQAGITQEIAEISSGKAAIE